MDIEIKQKVNKTQLLEELHLAVPPLCTCKMRLIEGSGKDVLLRIHGGELLSEVEKETIKKTVAEHKSLGDVYVSSVPKAIFYKESDMAENETEEKKESAPDKKTQAFDAMAGVMGAMLAPVIVAEVDKKIQPDIAALAATVKGLKIQVEASESADIARAQKIENDLIALSTNVNKINESVSKVSEKVNEAMSKIPEKIKQMLNGATIKIEVKG